MKKYHILLICFLLSCTVWAQQNPDSPGFDFTTENPDSANLESTSDNAEDPEQSTAAPVKPYERIVLNVDSLTNLITYTGIIEQEESSSDSLYVRFKLFAQKELAGGPKADAKTLYEVDKKNQKVIINATMPAYSYANKYAKKGIGKYQFKMTILFKEGRYKYTITNLVHEAEKPNVGTPARNYFEYYYSTNTSIKTVDSILRWADKDIQAMLDNMKKSMKEPIVVDEDEW
jgi:hypothetical protein